jgi:hypothetical protein
MTKSLESVTSKSSYTWRDEVAGVSDESFADILKI